MSKDVLTHITKYIAQNIDPLFHDRRREKLGEVTLNYILRGKNPYLFRSKNVLEAHKLVQLVLDAHLSSSEETIFGNFIENVAREACKQAYGGQKAPTVGIDIEFAIDNIRYLVSVKSGPKWGNSSQIAKMKLDFIAAQKSLRTSGGYKGQVKCIEGCCYGKNDKTDKGTHFKLCGQEFWELITGQENFYQDIIDPLGKVARQKTEAFDKQYAQKLNVLTLEFSEKFCANGIIDWNKLVKYNSGKHER
jgi:hypothetical protein